MKPTDIWTNCGIIFKPPCKNGSPCHVSAPRGSKTGTQGLKGAKDRGVIPPLLMEHVIKYCEKAHQLKLDIEDQRPEWKTNFKKD